jgi:hypothetical protein
MMIRFPHPALAIAFLFAAAPVLAVELSGALVSPTGALPPLKVVAQGESMDPPIVGKVEGGRYRIALPDSGRYHILVKAEGWEAAPKLVWDPKTAGGLDILVYPAEVPEAALAAELIEMARQDRVKPGDRAREQRLGAIIDAKSWPTMSMVGHEAATGAWTVAQHGSSAFLKRCLPLMQAAAARQEIDSQHLALSIDRARVEAGKPQVYGSQLHDVKGGKVEPDPIEDRANVDKRRAAMGMEPLAGYLARFGQ